jgi:hypothetical protein
MIRERQRNKRWLEQAEQAQEEAKHRPSVTHAIRNRPPGSPTRPDDIFEVPPKKRT